MESRELHGFWVTYERQPVGKIACEETVCVIAPDLGAAEAFVLNTVNDSTRILKSGFMQSGVIYFCQGVSE